MKRYVFILFIFLILMFSSPVWASKSLSKKTVIIDPGHGGMDPGTVSGKVLEKDLNLAISLALKDALIKKGAHVILLRSGDYDLSMPNATHRKKSDFDNRIKIINTSNADLYLSIHLNYLTDSKYKGIQVFSRKKYLSDAKILQNNLNNKLNSNRDAKLIPSSTYMYSRLNKKGFLIECGFLSNSEERTLLISKEYKNKVAKSKSEAVSVVLK